MPIVYRDGWSRAGLDAVAKNKILGSAKNCISDFQYVASHFNFCVAPIQICYIAL